MCSLDRGCHGVVTGCDPCRCSRPSWSSQVTGMWLRWCLLPCVDFSHSPHASTPQPWVLVAVPPTIHRSLNKASLAPQTWVQLGQCPPNSIAFRLVGKSVPPILLFVAACPWVYAVFCFEIRSQCVYVDRLDIASDGILHLDPIP